MRRALRWLLALVLLVAAGAGGAWLGRYELFRRQAGMPAFTHQEGGAEVVQVAMRDGVRLHTEVFLPEGLARAPTILVRNPYQPLGPLERFNCRLLNRYGYACVLQDVRGQLESEGEWHPIVNERTDGLDTLAWLVKQPFVDGNVAMRGTSYLACVQLAMADALPPEVKTLAPSVFGVDFRLAAYERGLFHHDILTAWAALMPGRGMRYGAGQDYLAAAAFRPALEADERVLGGKLPWYRELLDAEAPSAASWHSPQQEQFRRVPEGVKVPMLFFAGLFDPFLATELDTWQRLATRDRSVLVVGPWNHLGMTSGDLEPSVPTGRLDQWPLLLEWFDHHLKSRPLAVLQPGTVRTLGMGGSAWRVQPAWPDPGVATTTLHLGRARDAQDCSGGSLEAAATLASATSYRFDPDDPVPSRGGAAMLSFAFFRLSGVMPGPFDQGDSCARQDVLTFRSAPLPEARRLTGSGHLRLQVASTAPDTAFVARLIAEQDGKALLIRENAATLAYPTAAAQSAQAYAPGTRTTVEIDFWPTEWVLPAGARLRLDVTSSSFPVLHTHSNRAGPWAAQTGADVATQTVEVGDGRSVLELPLVPAG